MWSKIRTTLILLLISLASASVMYYMASQMTFRFHENVRTFCSFTQGMQGYHKMVGSVWLPRFFGNYLASLIVGKPPITQEHIKHAIGLYCFLWVLGINLTYVLFWGRRAVFFILGTLACVSFAYTWPIGEMVYPWDMPTLFFFTLSVQLIRCRKPIWLIVAVCLGTGFKETSTIIPITFLFWDMPIKQRLKYFFIAMASCLAVKMGIDLFTANKKLLVTADYEIFPKLWLWNAKHFAKTQLRHPMFINTGTMIAFFLLPWRKIEWAYKSVFIAFTILMFFFGGLGEYRVWFDMIPVCLLAFYYWMNYEEPSKYQTDPMKSGDGNDEAKPNPVSLIRDLISIFKKQK